MRTRAVLSCQLIKRPFLAVESLTLVRLTMRTEIMLRFRTAVILFMQTVSLR